jgi:acyl-CoA dehydrogenase
MDREIFSEEHDLFRASFRTFVEREVKPHQEKWAEEGCVSREAWRAAGAGGFLCPGSDPKYGGAGGDFLFSAIVCEELARAGESGFAIALHSDIIVPYIEAFGTEAQKQKYLPGCVTGEIITAIAMTEPDTGSDLAAVRTSAIRDEKTGGWILNGAKTFISNGQLCDLTVVVAKTDPDPKNAHKGISLFLVESTNPGFSRGRKLKKMGMASQDTSEMSFEDCRLPADALLGEEGMGFMYLMQKLQQERLIVALGSQAGAEQVLAETIAYTQQRKAFGKPISKFQNTSFKLAECATKVEVGRAFLDKLTVEHSRGKYLVKECSMAKLWQTEMFCEVVDTCLQFWGGYGYMLEYPITRAYMDARVQKIYAGTNEIMKIIISKQMGL